MHRPPPPFPPPRSQKSEFKFGEFDIGHAKSYGSHGNGSLGSSNASVIVNVEDYRVSCQPLLPFSRARRVALVMTLTGASFMNSLSVQSIVILLPSIGAELSIPEQRYQWMMSAYSIAFGCFLLFWGRVADLYGKRAIFIGGSIWVSLVILANACAPNEIVFNLFRGLHGLGAAANVPTAIGILGTTFPPGKAKNYAFSAYSAGQPVGAIFGNLLSGFIAQHAHWKWVFTVKAVLAGLVAAAGIFVIPEPPRAEIEQSIRRRAEGKNTIDWFGAVLITVGVLALLYAMTEGNTVGWNTLWIIIIIELALFVIVVFVIWQRRLEKKGEKPPLMRVSVFKNKQFSIILAITSIVFSAFINFLVFATYFYQGYQGLSPLDTTYRFIPMGVTGVITAFIVAILLSHVPTHRMLVFGGACLSVGCLLFAVPIPTETSYFAWGLPAMVLSVVGADITFPAVMLYTSKSLPQEDQAVGGALINAVGQIGRAIGLAVAVAAQNAVMAKARNVPIQDAGKMEPGDGPSLQGIRAGAWVNFGLSACGLLFMIFGMKGGEIIGKADTRRRARPSMSPSADSPTARLIPSPTSPTDNNNYNNYNNRNKVIPNFSTRLIYSPTSPTKKFLPSISTRLIPSPTGPTNNNNNFNILPTTTTRSTTRSSRTAAPPPPPYRSMRSSQMTQMTQMTEMREYTRQDGAPIYQVGRYDGSSQRGARDEYWDGRRKGSTVTLGGFHEGQSSKSFV